MGCFVLTNQWQINMTNNERIEALIVDLVANSPTQVNVCDLLIEYIKTLTKDEIMEFVERSSEEVWPARFDEERSKCLHEETYAAVRHESGVALYRCKKCNHKV
jgi:hypothetical protein